MRDRQPGPKHSSVAAVEAIHCRRRVIVQRFRDLAVAVIADPSGTETLAFQAEIGDLIEWVDGPQLRIEFQAVDDSNPIRQPDMFGTQIPMAIENAAASSALRQNIRAIREKRPLNSVDPANDGRGKPETRFEEYPIISGNAPAPFGHSYARTGQDTLRPSVEICERRHQPVELRLFNSRFEERVLERVAFVETAHNDKPIDDWASTAD